MRSNNALPNGHFHKNWQTRVRTWFGQATKKQSRWRKRVKKGVRKAPRPIHALRPIVHCPSARYSSKIRAGRGFTLDELKRARIHYNLARSIGIACDVRRRNRSFESLAANVSRLKEYRGRVILFPRSATAVSTGAGLNRVGAAARKERARVVTEEERKFEAYVALRKARSAAKLHSRRLKKKLAKGEEFP